MRGLNFPDIDYNQLSIPPAELKIVRRNGVLKVFDRLRKNYYCLTEEEFVRQTFVAWLIDGLNYPPSIMANEIGIRLNDTYKRCDTIVFSSNGHQPLMIIEYKSPKVSLTQSVFNQLIRYNMVLKAKYLVVSNGYSNFCCEVNYDNREVSFLKEIPDYKSIKE